MTKVRMEWTLAEFYGEGGTTRFVDRLAASLGRRDFLKSPNAVRTKRPDPTSLGRRDLLKGQTQ